MMLFSTSLRPFIFKPVLSLLIIVLFCNSILSFNNQTIKDLPDYSSSFQPSALCTDVQFNQAPEFKTGSEPRGVAVADFDGDDKQDIATAFSFGTPAGFSVMRNLGSNHFQPKQDFVVPSTISPEAIFVQDLDNDGKQDIVLTNSNRSYISIFRNISSGVGNIDFAPRVEFTVSGEQSKNVAFGDFDGDGSIDILTGSGESRSISILRNISAGTGNINFAPFISFPAGVVRFVGAGDLDGDNKLDVVTANYPSGTINVLKNNSTGIGNLNFNLSFSYDIPNFATAVMIADFDADGKKDISLSNSQGNNVILFRNTSTGIGNFSFASPVSFDTGLDPRGGVVADFNNDGKSDIAVSNQNGNSVSILQNTSSGAGTFSFAPRPWDFGVGISPYNLALGDFNSDGKPDLATANREGNNASVLINNGLVSGNVDFAARKDYLTLNKAGVTNVVSGDFDGDGNLDLAASLDEIRNVFKFSVYPNNGSGHFPARLDFSPIASPVTAIEPFIISSGDFDNDGKTDVVMTGSWQQGSGTFYGLRVFRSTSSGPGNFSFALSNYSATFQAPYRVFVVDLDGDGKLDIIATHKQLQYDETALIFRNTGSGIGSISFSQAGSFILQGGATISFADFNSDNKIDLAYSPSNYSSNILRVQLNTSLSPGQIGFEQHDVSNPQVNIADAITGDLDGDGKPDLIKTNYLLGNISNSGTLNFAAPVLLPNLDVIPAEAIDLNGDGKNDVVGRGSSFISIFKNISTASSVNLDIGKLVAIGGGASRNLVFADLDKNGKLDVINGYSHPFIGTISVLLNQECQPRRNITLFDFDGDGRADNSVFRSGVWYINQSQRGFAGVNWGFETDVLAPADYDGDGRTDVAVFRDGNWYWLNSSTNQFSAVQFGIAGDIVTPADFDGDGKADVSVFRPSNGAWYRLNSSQNNQFFGAQFGSNGDKPLVGDFDGDGKADLAVTRTANERLFWYWTASSTNQFNAVQFGLSADIVTPADYDGDGKTDVSVFRPSNGAWYRLNSSQNNQFSAIQFGQLGDVPVPADYDGDGKADVTVFRQGNWYRMNSSNNSFYAEQFGVSSDKPIPNAFLR